MSSIPWSHVENKDFAVESLSFHLWFQRLHSMVLFRDSFTILHATESYTARLRQRKEQLSNKCKGKKHPHQVDLAGLAHWAHIVGHSMDLTPWDVFTAWGAQSNSHKQSWEQYIFSYVKCNDNWPCWDINGGPDCCGNSTGVFFLVLFKSWIFFLSDQKCLWVTTVKDGKDHILL